MFTPALNGRLLTPRDAPIVAEVWDLATNLGAGFH